MTKNKNQAKKTVCSQSLPLIHANGAGIDVGAKEHVVAVPADRDPEPVRSFKAFTPDLHELADWLKQCGVETVALESTGIYWITLYEILEERGASRFGGQRAACQERARSHQDRRARLPVDPEASQFRLA
jgi:transposase